MISLESDTTLDLGATEPREVVAVLTRYVLALRLAAAALTGLTLTATRASTVLVLVIPAASVASYLVLHSWRGIGTLVLRHPLLLGVDSAVGLLVLSAAGPESPWLLVTLSNAALAGLFFRRQGAGAFTVLLSGGYLLGVVVPLAAPPALSVHVLLVLPLLYPLTAFAASGARDVLERAARGAVLARCVTQSQATASERARLAREMHDSVSKSLYGLAMMADALPQLAERHPEELSAQAAMISAAAKVAVSEGRDLLRDMRADLPNAPLAEALGQLVQRTLGDSPVRATCRVQVPPELPVTPDIRYELLAVLGEALRNVDRHAQARAVCVLLDLHEDRLRLSVEDDGVGFDPPAVLRELSAAGHHGVAGMQERAESVRGRLTISRCPTGGTLVVLEVPLLPAALPVSAGGRRA